MRQFQSHPGWITQTKSYRNAIGITQLLNIKHSLSGHAEDSNHRRHVIIQ